MAIRVGCFFRFHFDHSPRISLSIGRKDRRTLDFCSRCLYSDSWSMRRADSIDTPLDFYIRYQRHLIAHMHVARIGIHSIPRYPVCRRPERRDQQCRKDHSSSPSVMSGDAHLPSTANNQLNGEVRAEVIPGGPSILPPPIHEKAVFK